MSPIPCFIGSVASIGGGSIPLQVSMVWVCTLGEMWAVSPIHCFIGSVASSGGGSFLAGFNGLGVSPLYCFPLQVRAVVAMVKFSHLTNFVLNKKNSVV